MCHQYPQILDLVTSYYQPLIHFENFEIKLANEDIERQSQGGRPQDNYDPGQVDPSEEELEVRIHMSTDERDRMNI